MAEILDYYSFSGLPRTSTWEEVKKKVNQRYLEFLKKANVKGPGSKEAEQRDFWAKALEFFKDEASKSAYDAQLEAWLKSPAAKETQAKAKSAAEDFAQKSASALEFLQQAWRELERGNVAEAMLLAGKAVALEPSSWEAYFALGLANFRSSDLNEAMSCFRSAARLNPKSADPLAAMGEVYERQERWKDSYEQYRQAAAIEPNTLAHQISMGLVCVKAGVPDEGIEILRACQIKDPDDPGLNWVLGVALSESARLGWTYVDKGHPRVPEGWYAMSREQALQAVAKLHEASTLRFEDPDLSKHLAQLKSDVDNNVRRHFTGSWILLGLLGVLAVFGSGVAAKLLIGALAAAYYVVNLVPQYAINARVLAGEHALKRGFFDWLDNLNNPWIKLAVLSVLFMLLPIFIVYWGIRNWTGSNAPLGKVVGDIQSTNMPDADIPNGSESTDKTVVPSPGTPSASAERAVASSANIGGRVITASTAQSAASAPTQGKLPTENVGNKSAPYRPPTARSGSSLANANKTVIVVAAGVVVLVIALGALFVNRSKEEKRMSAGGGSAPGQAQLDSRMSAGGGSAPGQAQLDSKWRGFWSSADGRRVRSISEQRIDGIDRVFREGQGENQFQYTLKLVQPKAALQEEQFAFSGKSVSVEQLKSDYEDSVRRFKAGEPDFHVDLKKTEQLRSDFLKFKPGSYQELEGYGGGDCGVFKWYNDGDHILEVTQCKYTHDVTMLSRSTEASAEQAYNASRRTQPELPAQVPPDNASVGDAIQQPRIRVGDRHTFETIDMVDSRLNNVVVREVVSISGDEVIMKFVNQKSSYERLLTYDRDLGLVRTRFGQGDGANYNPAIKYVKVPGRVGESWVSKSTETNLKTGKTREHVINGRIDGKETVTVPAGSFETFRIIINSEVRDEGKVSTGQDTSWFSPQVGRSVKSELRSRDPTGKEGHRVVRLLTYSPGQ